MGKRLGKQHEQAIQQAVEREFAKLRDHLSKQLSDELEKLVEKKCAEPTLAALNAYADGVTSSLGLSYDASPIFNDFDAQTLGFHIGNAIQLARGSSLIYKDHHVIDWELQRSGYQDHQYLSMTNPTTGTKFLAVDASDAIFIIFQGTSSLQDWLTNLRMGKLPLNHATADARLVHAGFQSALDSVWGPLEEFLTDKNGGRNKAIWLTGHSLGGALATLAAGRIGLKQNQADTHHRIMGLYTFGQPRVGNGAMARFIDSNLHGRYCRIVNASDVVPWVPPRWLFYSDAGELRYIDSRGRLTGRIPLLIPLEFIASNIDYVLEWLISRVMNRIVPTLFRKSLVEAHGSDIYLSHLKSHAAKAKPRAHVFLRLAGRIVLILLFLYPVLIALDALATFLHNVGGDSVFARPFQRLLD